MKARTLGFLHGKPVRRFPVKVTFGRTAAVHQVCHYPNEVVEVIAHTPQEAADLVQSEVAGVPCVEIEVFGLRGGIAAHRYQGFESAIGQQMMAERPAYVQTALFGHWLQRNTTTH